MPKTSAPTPDLELGGLHAAIEELIQHVRLLTRAVDDLTTELQRRNNELRNDGRPGPPFAMTSMPRDQTADDWELNRLERDGTHRTAQPPRAGGRSVESMSALAGGSRLSVQRILRAPIRQVFPEIRS